jgi:hypothetical protein
MLVLPVGGGPQKLVLTGFVGGEFGEYTAIAEAPGLDVSVAVVSHRDDGLSSFLESLAADWRGFEGVRTWRSLESHLSIEASADSLGHIELTVELRPDPYPTSWRVSIVIQLDSGSLGEVAREARRFFLL